MVRSKTGDGVRFVEDRTIVHAGGQKADFRGRRIRPEVKSTPAMKTRRDSVEPVAA